MLRFEYGFFARTAQKFADNFRAVGGIEDGEVFFVTDMVRLFAQNLHAQRVEGANRQPARLRFGQHFGDAFLHFRGGFIGKGNCSDGMRQIADIDDQMLDFLRNHAGFTAARRQDEQGPPRYWTAACCWGLSFIEGGKTGNVGEQLYKQGRLKFFRRPWAFFSVNL